MPEVLIHSNYDSFCLPAIADYQLARILAMETVTEAPFQEISDEAFARACELMKSCERVIDTGVPVGMCNRRIEELRAEAKRLGKLAE